MHLRCFMSAIFISHSSKDNDFAAQIAAWLKQRSFSWLFLDFDPQFGIPAGRNWERELYRQLRVCRAVIVLCSEHSTGSDWWFAEVVLARSLGKSLFPVRLDGSAVPSLLSDHQVIDFRQNREEAYERLAIGLDQAGLDSGIWFSWDPHRTPYPGLMAFQAEDAAMFFGRDDAIQDGLEQVRNLRRYGGKGFLMILGASGSGKSSLLRAGLLPRLQRDPQEWLVLDPFRPGADPFTELAIVLAAASALHGQALDHEEIADSLRPAGRDAEAARDALERRLDKLRLAIGRREVTVVVSIDQFEELLPGGGKGLDASAAARRQEGFLQMLQAALRGADGRLVVLGTLRSDLLGIFKAHPVLREVPFDQLLIGPMRMTDYARIIEGPAELAGLKIEPGLTQRMVLESETDDALPLLAFTLRELWERHSRDVNQLTVNEYEELEGLIGSVQRAANAVMGARTLSTNDWRDVRQAFLAMARIDDEGRFARQPVRWEDLPPSSRPILQGFVDARLLVSGKQTGTVEVAHEALLRNWSLLKGWLDEDRDFLLWRRRLRDALEEYRRSGSLLRDAPLTEAERWRDTTAEASPERQLIDASIASERERKLRELEAAASLRTAEEESRILGQAVQEGQKERNRLVRQGKVILAALSSLAAVIGLGALVALRQLTMAQAATALEQSSAALLRQHRDDQLTGLMQAMTNGFRLRRFVGDDHRLIDYPTVAPLAALDTILAATYERNRLQAHRHGVVRITTSDKAGLIASIGRDDRIALWERSGRLRRTLPLAEPTAVVFSDDGHTLFAANADGTVLRADLATGALHQWQAQPIGGVNALAVGPEGSRLYTAGGDGTVTVWSPAGKRLAGWKAAPELDGVEDLAFDPSRRLLATVGETSGTVRLWNSLGEQVAMLKSSPHDSGPLLRVAFSPSGNRLLASGPTSEAYIWNLDHAGAAQLAMSLRSEGASIRSQAFLDKGRHLVLGDKAGVIHVWSAAGKEVAMLRGHQGPVTTLTALPGGIHLASGGRDGSLREWQQPMSPVESLAVGTSEVNDLSFRPRSEQLALALGDGSLQIRSESGGKLRQWSTRRGSLSSLDIAPDGGRVVVAGTAGRVRIWSWKGEEGPRKLADSGSLNTVQFSPSDGSQILAGAADGSLWFWSTQGAERLRLKAHEGGVASVAFHPSGRTFASAGIDGTLRTWTSSGRPRRTTKLSSARLRSLTFSADGSRLVAGGDEGRLVILDGSGDPRSSFPTYQTGITAVKLSPLSDLIASAGADGSVKFWDPRGRPVLAEEPGVGSPLYTLDFDAKGERLAAGGDRGRLVIRRVDGLNGLLRRGCDWLENALSMNRQHEELRESCRGLK